MHRPIELRGIGFGYQLFFEVEVLWLCQLILKSIESGDGNAV
jgi:hypothetical protein